MVAGAISWFTGQIHGDFLSRKQSRIQLIQTYGTTQWKQANRDSNRDRSDFRT